MNIRSKLWEIGLLCAHWQASGSIVSVFLIQGLLLGLFAFMAGSVAFLLASPWLQAALQWTIRLPREVVTYSTADLLLLLGIAGILATAGPLLAVLPSVVRASRLPPPVLFQNRG